MAGRNVPADHYELMGDAAMGDWNARQRGHSYGTCHTRHDCDRNPRVGARQHLFVTPGEDERIAALESHDVLPRLGPVNEDLVDGVLGHRPPIRDLRGVDDLDLWGELGQQFLRREPIRDDDVGVGQQALGIKSFRPGQAEAFEHLLANQDLLAVMPTGSGKSTTAMACAAAGLGYLGDDYVLGGESGGRSRAHALYTTAKLTERSLDLLPALRALADGSEAAEEKAVIQLKDSPFGAQLMASAPIAAIVLPRIAGGQQTWWEPATASRALTALAPTTLFQLPGAGGAALARLARLVRSVPAVTLHLGQDMEGIAPALCAAVAAVAARSAP